MDDEDLLDEYIMNDQGKIYKGMSVAIKPMSWNYSQFEANILDCSLYLLDKCSLEHGSRDDPIKIIRTLTSIVSTKYMSTNSS